MYDFDLLVIGAGSGGVRAARTAAMYGAKVAIVEDKYLGGTCVNVGCIPKKLYSMASHYHYDYEDSEGFGWQVATPLFDWHRLRSNKQDEIKRLNGVYDNLLRNSGVKLLQGRGSFVDAHTVAVGGDRISARHILIATGAWPHVPQVKGREFILTSNEIFDLDEFPERLLIVGGGYIATEFAGIFAGLGARTTLCYRGDMPLSGFDEDVRRHFFKEAGKHVHMLMRTEVESIEKSAGGDLAVHMKDGTTHEVSAVLYATGRKPNTSGLGLENTRVQLRGDGGIRIDAGFRTDEPSIYAVGDVAGPIALTPVALAEGMYVANHLFGDKSRRMSYDNVATAVFSHPNIGTVGLSEAKAREQCTDVVVYESEFRELRHTLSGRQERTYMKLIVDGATDRVLGMHMVGAATGEIIQGFAAAMTCGVTKAQLDATIGIHPTVAEEFVTMRTPRRSA